MKYALVLFSLGLLLTLGLTACFGHDSTSPDQNIDQSGPDKEASDESSGVEGDKLLTEIVRKAKQGKVAGVDFIVGKADIADVEENWGKTDEKSETDSGIYITYADRQVAFGYFRHAPVFDVRSYDDRLKTITLSQIEEAMGAPDDVRFYKDQMHDQQILVYNVNDMYQLKWILQKPNEDNPDPRVHHISVYAKDISSNSVAAVIHDMTLDEKIGQMMMVGLEGTQLDSQVKTFIKQYHVGGVIFLAENIENTQQTVQLINQLKDANVAANNPLPLFISVDEEGGQVSRLPDAIVNLPSNGRIGNLNVPSFSYEIGQFLGQALHALGFNMDFAPVLDIADPNASVIGDRSFGANKEVVSNLGVKTMQGIQSQNVISVLKHFPGYGAASVDAHTGLPKVDHRVDHLEGVDWVPYKKAIQNGADTVMVTHMLLPKLDAQYPASMSKAIITDMLRNKLHFDGVVITDDMTMGAIVGNYEIGRAAVQAVKAGNDIVMIAHGYDQEFAAIQALKVSVKSGEISEERIDDSVYRIIQLKREYDLTDQPIGDVNVDELNQEMDSILEEYLK